MRRTGAERLRSIPLTLPAPFADTRDRLAVRAGRLLDVETGQMTADRTLLVGGGRRPPDPMPPECVRTTHDEPG